MTTPGEPLVEPPVIRLPPGALVLLVGPSGAGKTTFARRHFGPSEVLSSDGFRAIVADDPEDQRATDDAFRLLHLALRLRLSRGRISVVDATNVEAWARALLLDESRRLRRPSVAIVFDLPLDVCLDRNAARPRPRPPAAIRRQHRWLRDSIAQLPHEGITVIHRLRSVGEVDAMSVVRVGAPPGGDPRRRNAPKGPQPGDGTSPSRRLPDP
ncbi:MAG TPA: AAA family ATPase [Candidatus Limnocylindria bacterium]|nr:AAA family ATPase [Candidatus Limnocylindria bacterium]